MDERYYLVDLPGYGYAKVEQGPAGGLARPVPGASWPPRTAPWRSSSCWTCATGPAPRTGEVAGWIRASGHPWALAVTKIDKVGTNARRGRYQEIISALDAPADTPFFPTSSSRGLGAGEMHQWVEALLAAAAAG